MKGIINFNLHDNNNGDGIKTLQDLLDGTGMEAKIIDKKIGNQNISILSIFYDTDIIKTKKKRNAGRPYTGHLGRYTCDDIKKMQKTMTNKEIASLLGVSERTFYRRLKENSVHQNNEEFL